MKLYLLFVFAAIFSVASADLNGCTYNDTAAGNYYDLSSLMLASDLALSEYYFFNATDASEIIGNYLVNICGPVSVESGCPNALTGVCQIVQPAPFLNYTCGLADDNDAYFEPYDGEDSEDARGVSLVYTAGDACPGAGIDRNVRINIGCRANVTTFEIESVVENGACNYVMQGWSSVVCDASVPETVSASPMPTVDATVSASPISTVDATVSASPISTVDATVSASPMPTALNVTASVTPSVSVVNGTAPTPTPTTTSSDSGSNAWIWWTLAALVVVVIIAVAAVAGFVVWKKRQQTHAFDPIEYE